MTGNPCARPGVTGSSPRPLRAVGRRDGSLAHATVTCPLPDDIDASVSDPDSGPSFHSRLSAQGIASTLRLDGCRKSSAVKGQSVQVSTENQGTIGPK